MFSKEADELALHGNALAIETALINAYYKGQNDGMVELSRSLQAKWDRVTKKD
jgi:hypothetical protein